MKTVKVSFTGNHKGYNFLCADDTIKAGDYAIVPSQYGYPYAIAYVDAVFEGKQPPATKHIISKVDTTEYEQLQARQEKLVDIQKQLDAFVAKQQKISIYETFAANNPEISELVKELKELL